MAEALFGNGGFVAFVAGGEIVFERIHVWWEFGDFAEDDGEIEGEQHGDEMKSAVHDAQEKGGKDGFVCCAVLAEERLPSAFGIF